MANKSKLPKSPASNYEETVIEVNRVSKKTKGGNTIGFSVLTVAGDKKGKVGVGLGKGPDVASSIRKSLNIAKKNMIDVPMVKNTIPHRIVHKYGAAQVMLKPAPVGAGVIAGGAVRSVLSAAGIRDVVAKILGSKNKINNVYCVYEALQLLKSNRSDN